MTKIYSRHGKLLSYSSDDPIGQCFICTTNDISSGSGGAESNQILIRNTSADKHMRIFRILTSTCVSSNNNIFRFYRNPTWSAVGTDLTSTNVVFESGAPAAECSVSTAPTITDKGTRFMTFCQGATSTSALDSPYSFVLHPNESILVTVRPNANGVTYALTLFWMEELD